MFVKTLIVAAAIFAAVTPALALAGASDDAPRMATVKRTLPDTKDYYPFAAADAEMSGSATVLCTVLDTGRLGDCTVIQESPTGYGFGAAVKQVAEDMVVVDLETDKPGEKVAYHTAFNLNR
jgi:protein TonB